MAGSFLEADRTPLIRTYGTYVDTYRTYVRPALSSRLARPMAAEATCRALDAAQGRGTPPLRGDRRSSPRSSRSSATPELLDRRSIAVGPFARLDAGAVAGRDGKTRGVISNLFGSQATFQAETMERALDAGDWIEQLDYPAPADHPDAGAWLDAFFAGRVGARAAPGRQAEGRLRRRCGRCG